MSLRLLGLADYYYNFCKIYRDEPLEPDYLNWAEELSIAPFRLGQLVGAETALNDEADEGSSTRTLLMSWCLSLRMR